MRKCALVCAAAALATLSLTAVPAFGVLQITNFAGGTQSPLSDGDTTLTVLPGSAQLQSVAGAGFKNAFSLFITRGFPGSLSEQLLLHSKLEFTRDNTPNPLNVSGFINSFFVLNTNTPGVGGYTVLNPPTFLDPNNPGGSAFSFDYGANAVAKKAMIDYYNGLGGYMVIHIVQQSGGPTDVKYGDLFLRGNPVPEPAALGTLAAGLPLLLRRRR